jgi:glycosyltransferase involved in cell wall biosynthesis
MKVLYILPYHWGGMSHYTAEIANAMSKSEEVFVLTTQNVPSSYFSDKVTLIRNLDDLDVSINQLRGIFKFKNICSLISFKNVRVIKQINPDIIHITTPLIPPLAFCIFLFRIDKNYSIIYTKHQIYALNHKSKIVVENILKFFEKLIDIRLFIIHTKEDKYDLIKEYGVSEKQSRIVPHGIYTFFQGYKKITPVENNTIIFFGRIDEYKGIEYLIEAVPLIVKKIPDVKIIIAGNGDFSHYQSLIDTSGRSLFELHIEFVPDETVATLFQRSSVVILPYTQMSGMSGVLNIAYAFGKPVIVSNVGGLDEAVEHGKTGLLVPPKDPFALADAIIKLLSDSDLRRNMENCVKAKADELSWDRVAMKTMAVYQQVLNEVKK